MAQKDPRASIPQVEILLSMPLLAHDIARLSRPLAAAVIARTLEAYRRGLGAQASPDSMDVPAVALERCVEALAEAERGTLTKVLNGTGVVLHTNLGRSPLSKAVWKRAEAVNIGYSNLEYDLGKGRRGSRGGIVPELLRLLSGAEAALAVNNNAAAVLLALSALASGKEVLVSRGEAVQIGGGFRIPEILALSGARLREVGTTNITTLDDYRRAIGPETGAVLVVHRSNFAIRGFTEKPRLADLSAVLHGELPLIVDQGSGRTEEGPGTDGQLRRLVAEGADLVCFSGDKLLGGPQAGLVVGRAGMIAMLASHPLMRAFRPGKTILSLLEAVLIERLGAELEGAGSSACLRALTRSQAPGLAELEALGARLLAALPDGRASLVPAEATLGGGTTPDETIETRALALKPLGSPEMLSGALRGAPTPLVARIEAGLVFVDLMTLAEEDPALIAESILAGFAMEGRSW